MPFKSRAQRAYLYAHDPKVAAEFQRATPKGAKLPERVKKRRTNVGKQVMGAR